MQTVIRMADYAVQCSLIPAPPLSLLNQPLIEKGRTKEIDTVFDSSTEEETLNESDDDYLCDDTEETIGECASR